MSFLSRKLLLVVGREHTPYKQTKLLAKKKERKKKEKKSLHDHFTVTNLAISRILLDYLELFVCLYDESDLHRVFFKCFLKASDSFSFNYLPVKSCHDLQSQSIN